MKRRPAVLQVGVVGAGVMGTRHAKTIAAHPSTTLTAVVDHALFRAEQAASFEPRARAATSLDALDRCDAVVVATSTGDHRDVAMSLMSRGIPVLVEKPLGLTPADFDAIVECSKSTGAALMCGFVERFNSAWMAARHHLDGVPTSIRAIRDSPAARRDGSGVVTDVMIHDLDLASSLLGVRDGGVPAVLRCDALDADAVDAEIEWGSGRRAKFSADRDASVRRRVVRTHWDTGHMEIDLLAAHLAVVSHRPARTESFDCQSAETPLSRQLSHFVALVDGELDSDGERASMCVSHELAYEIERAITCQPAPAMVLGA